MTGSVKSIGTDSIVLSQAFEEDGDADVKTREGTFSVGKMDKTKTMHCMVQIMLPAIPIRSSELCTKGICTKTDRISMIQPIFHQSRPQ